MERRERQTGATRNKIKKAALALFCKNGIEAADWTRIAADAGVSRRTMYHHYTGKESLAAELYLDNLRNLSEALAPELKMDNLLKSLENQLERYLQLRIEHPEWLYFDIQFQLYYSSLGKNPGDLPEYESILEGSFQSLLAEGVLLGKDDSEEWAKAMDALFASSRLFYDYLQKSVVHSWQRNKRYGEDSRAADNGFKRFLLAGAAALLHRSEQPDQN